MGPLKPQTSFGVKATEQRKVLDLLAEKNSQCPKVHQAGFFVLNCLALKSTRIVLMLDVS